MLVHEPKRMHELVHGHDQTVAKAARVQVHHLDKLACLTLIWICQNKKSDTCLLPSPHPQLASAIPTWVDRHEVWTGGGGQLEGDAREQVGDVVHRLPRQVPQV